MSFSYQYEEEQIYESIKTDIIELSYSSVTTSTESNEECSTCKKIEGLLQSREEALRLADYLNNELRIAKETIRDRSNLIQLLNLENEKLVAMLPLFPENKIPGTEENNLEDLKMELQIKNVKCNVLEREKESLKNEYESLLQEMATLRSRISVSEIDVTNSRNAEYFHERTSVVSVKNCNALEKRISSSLQELYNQLKDLIVPQQHFVKAPVLKSGCATPNDSTEADLTEKDKEIPAVKLQSEPKSNLLLFFLLLYV